MLFENCNSQDTIKDNYADRCEEMIKNQIESRGISDSVILNAFRKVPRHLFVPPVSRSLAYGDFPVPIGYGQTISQPYIIALMTEVIKPKSSDKILEIGTGSGYQAAILAEIVDSVYTIEIVKELSIKTQKIFQKLGYSNIVTKTGDGYLGWPEHATFDAIIVTCAPSEIPITLKEQLKDGGSMIIPVGAEYSQELVLITKNGIQFEQKIVSFVRFVPMTKEAGGVY